MWGKLGVRLAGRGRHGSPGGVTRAASLSNRPSFHTDPAILDRGGVCHQVFGGIGDTLAAMRSPLLVSHAEAQALGVPLTVIYFLQGADTATKRPSLQLLSVNPTIDNVLLVDTPRDPRVRKALGVPLDATDAAANAIAYHAPKRRCSLPPTVSPTYFVPESYPGRVRAVRQAAAGRPVVAIAPFGKTCIPSTVWADLMRRFLEHGAYVCVSGSRTHDSTPSKMELHGAVDQLLVDYPGAMWDNRADADVFDVFAAAGASDLRVSTETFTFHLHTAWPSANAVIWQMYLDHHTTIAKDLRSYAASIDYRRNLYHRVTMYLGDGEDRVSESEGRRILSRVYDWGVSNFDRPVPGPPLITPVVGERNDPRTGGDPPWL